MWDNEAAPSSTTEECIFTLWNEPCEWQKELQGDHICDSLRLCSWASNRSWQISASSAEICVQTATCWSGAFPGTKFPRVFYNTQGCYNTHGILLLLINNVLWSGRWAQEVSQSKQPSSRTLSGGRLCSDHPKILLGLQFEISLTSFFLCYNGALHPLMIKSVWGAIRAEL